MPNRVFSRKLMIFSDNYENYQFQWLTCGAVPDFSAGGGVAMLRACFGNCERNHSSRPSEPKVNTTIMIRLPYRNDAPCKAAGGPFRRARSAATWISIIFSN